MWATVAIVTKKRAGLSFSTVLLQLAEVPGKSGGALGKSLVKISFTSKKLNAH